MVTTRVTLQAVTYLLVHSTIVKPVEVFNLLDSHNILIILIHTCNNSNKWLLNPRNSTQINRQNRAKAANKLPTIL